MCLAVPGKIIEIDKEKNIVVCGTEYSAIENTNFHVIKYDSSGNVLWECDYDNQHQRDDTPLFLSVDTTGNVYILGKSEYPGNGIDYGLLKVSSDGEPEWAAHYDGTGNTRAVATQLAIDANADIYVTGYSWEETNNNFTTIKYDDSGIEKWIAEYAGPSQYDEDRAVDLDIDAAGNVFVTGRGNGESSSSDFVTIKYDSYGQEDWLEIYDTDEHRDDDVNALARDTFGNIFITGSSYLGNSKNDFLTASYTNSGGERWIARFDCSNGNDEATDITIDNTNNIIITGYSTNEAGKTEFRTIKYFNDGEIDWSLSFPTIENGGQNLSHKAVAVTHDNDGNVYVTGEIQCNNSTYDIATIKYTSEGSIAWTAHYDGSAHHHDRPAEIAVDNNGNVFVSGKSTNFDGSYDIVTIKYDAAGNEVWVKKYNGSGNGDDWAVDLVLDDEENVYVTGNCAALDYSYNIITIKYSSDSQTSWEILYDGPGGYDETVNDLAIDVLGNVYVTGVWVGRDNVVSTIIKYSQNGTGIDYGKHITPEVYHLFPNYPNPFNATTTLRYSIPIHEHVHIEIFSLIGQKIATLVNEKKDKGRHEIIWNAINIASGIYLCRMQAGDFSHTKKIILLK